MMKIDELDEDSIVSDEVFEELFDMQDHIEFCKRKLALGRRAKALGVKGDFDDMFKGYQKVANEILAQEKNKNPVCTVEGYTNFIGPYDNMFCKAWVATEDGVFAQKSGETQEVACYHPILPVERLRNLETGEEQIKLAYKRNNYWQEVIVPKVLVSSASKIVSLAGKGIAVTSENARLLVKYLADVENANEDYIDIQYSTSKLGWNGDDFIPYDSDILFDGDSRFRQTFESISEHGDYDIWLEHVKELRRSGRMEVKFLLAASFSSVLVSVLGVLPFFVDLWGETEGGKTVSLMVSASVWANPDESRYIGDFKTTDVALEAKADMLNNLPMFLDDTSKTSSRIRDNFEGIVYDLCSGKGKSRSNKDLGINRENRWKNVFICNGERPLNSYVNQGGAINRILEVECGEKIYRDPQVTAETVKRNYGFAGKHFVQIVKGLGADKIRDIQTSIQKELFSMDKMQKQSMALSVVLTADKIATDYIFKDGQYISIDDAKSVLVDRNIVSDNERCYRFVLDKVAMNSQRFDLDANCEKWGIIDSGYAIFYNVAFEQICKEGGFSKKAFLSWADKNGKIKTDGKRMTKLKRIDGNPVRCIWLKLDDGTDEDGFVPANLDEIQENLPFEP